MSLKLLIVEDELPMLNSIKMYFEFRGYNVFATPKGDDALGIIDREKPHAILLDLHLKDSIVTGIDILKAAHEKYPDIKVIISSGYSDDPEIRKMCMQYNPYRITGKPVIMVDMQKILEEIRSALSL